MRVLLTGASGHVGRHVLRELLGYGHTVRCFVRQERAGRQILHRHNPSGGVEIVMDDLRDARAVHDAVAGQEAVIHLAAMIPPLSDHHPALARAVNVGGTQNLIVALQAQSLPARLIYTSTVALFGNTQALPPPRRVGDPLAPMDPYSMHKLECERLVATSGLTWTILRLAAVPRLREGFDPLRLRAMFAVPLSDRIEMLHPYDAGFALANAVTSAEIWGKTFIVAGGQPCRMLMRDYYQTYLDALGVGALPARYFATTSYHLDWYDTDESQALLSYQRHSHKDFVRHCRDEMTLLRWAITPIRPLARFFILQYSATGLFGEKPRVQPAERGHTIADIAEEL